MWKETYRYIVAVFMVSILYNIHKAHASNLVGNQICNEEILRRGPHQHGLCGDSLPDILDTVCIFGYNSRGKREISKVKTQLPLQDVTMSRADASAYLISKKGTMDTTGIVCECCYHSCSPNELLTYCFIPNFFRKRGEQILKTKRTQRIGSQEKLELQ